MVEIIVYLTSCPATLKLKSDITRLKSLLDTKKVAYTEVTSPLYPEATIWPSGSADDPSQMLQVDLATEPASRRHEMVEKSGSKAIPQLHVAGKVQEVVGYLCHCSLAGRSTQSVS